MKPFAQGSEGMDKDSLLLLPEMLDEDERGYNATVQQNCVRERLNGSLGILNQFTLGGL